MIGDALLLLFGMTFLLGGGEMLVRGAAALARAVGVSPLVVGLTVVSFGTSAPELAVNVMAAWNDNGALSFGNIVGSNIANIGLIVALAALLRPLNIHSVVLLRELPMMMLATAVLSVLAFDGFFSGRDALLDRGDGTILLLVFTVFIYYMLNEVVTRRRVPPSPSDVPGAGIPAVIEDGGGEPVEPLVEVPAEEEPLTPTACTALVLGGATALVLGAKLTVDGAVGLATALGVPEVVIGLTLVAVGTSLPELVASLIAALRGQADIAVGNIVGSNIFNLLLVGGACAAVRPIPIPDGGTGDLAVMIGLSLLLWLVGATRERRIIRAEAALLLALYATYLFARLSFLALP